MLSVIVCCQLSIPSSPGTQSTCYTAPRIEKKRDHRYRYIRWTTPIKKRKHYRCPLVAHTHLVRTQCCAPASHCLSNLPNLRVKNDQAQSWLDTAFPQFLVSARSRPTLREFVLTFGSGDQTICDKQLELQPTIHHDTRYPIPRSHYCIRSRAPVAGPFSPPSTLSQTSNGTPSAVLV